MRDPYRAVPGLARETMIVEDARLALRRAGECGPPLVFIHGWADSSIVWRRSLAYWGQRYRAIAFDQPGHGGSAPTAVEGGALAIAARLHAALDALALDGVTLVGHSFGGLIALLMARYFPARLARLVLVDAAWYGPGVPMPPLPPALRRPLALAGLTALRPARRVGAALLAPLLTRVDGRYEDQFRRWHALTEAEPWWLARTVEMIAATDLRGEVEKIALPALVMTGSDDRTVPPINARLLAALLPRGEFAPIRGVGHHPMEDRFERFRETVDTFLG